MSTKPALAIEHTDTTPSENNNRETAHVNHIQNSSGESTLPSWHQSFIGDVSQSLFVKSSTLSVRDVHWLLRDLVTMALRRWPLQKCPSPVKPGTHASPPVAGRKRISCPSQFCPHEWLNRRTSSSVEVERTKWQAWLHHGSVKIQPTSDVANQLRSKEPTNQRLESRFA